MPHSFDIIEVNKDILQTTQKKSTILVDPLDYGMTFELPNNIALSVKSLDDINLDVNRHICMAHFYVVSTSLAI